MERIREGLKGRVRRGTHVSKEYPFLIWHSLASSHYIGSSEDMDQKGPLALQSRCLESSWRWRWYRNCGAEVGEWGGYPAYLQWGLHRIEDPYCHRWEVTLGSEHKQKL